MNSIFKKQKKESTKVIRKSESLKEGSTIGLRDLQHNRIRETITHNKQKMDEE